MFCRELDQHGRYYALRKILDNAMINVRETTAMQQPEINDTWGKEVYFKDMTAA